MPNDQINIALKNGFDTNQISIKNGHLVVADNAAKSLINVVGRTIGQKVELGKKYDLSKIPVNWRSKTINILPLLKTMAARKIDKKYSEIGEKHSALGLPIDAGAGVQHENGTFFKDYRGGRIEVKSATDNSWATAVKRYRVEIWWVGLENRLRQEKGMDEIYGSIAGIAPGSGFSMSHKFPDDQEYWSMGKGMRIVNTGVKIYDGPPMDLVLVNSLVEHDSGNIDKYKQKFAELITKTANGLAAMAGVPAEITAADQGFISDLSFGLVNGISNALGMKDDPYVPQQLRILWSDIQKHNFSKQDRRSPDTTDPRSITYTHSIGVTGIDDGGDRGEYHFYYEVKLFEENEIF